MNSCNEGLYDTYFSNFLSVNDESPVEHDDEDEQHSEGDINQQLEKRKKDCNVRTNVLID